jgi:hypothetical protein
MTTTPEPTYPPLSTTEIRTLPEGARVIVTWSDGNDGPHEYRVHWRRGEPYAQTDEDHRQGNVDLEKWLTYYGGRDARSRESGLAPLRVPNDAHHEENPNDSGRARREVRPEVAGPDARPGVSVTELTKVTPDEFGPLRHEQRRDGSSPRRDSAADERMH